MAAGLLRSWKAPELVTSVEIDASAGRVGATVRTTMSGLETLPTGMRWSQKDDALPMPLDP